MKRIPVLAFLLALAPFSWAEEIVKEAEVVPSAEATDVVSENAADLTPPATSETSTVTPVGAEAAAQSTVTPVVSDPAGTSPAVPASETEGTPAVVPAGTEASHKVVKGDTLWGLAGSYLKNPFLWPQIYDANRDKIENPRLIFPNQEFLIPTVEAAAALPPSPVVETPAEAPAVAQEPVSEPVVAEPMTEPVSAPVAESVAEPETSGDVPAEAVAEDMDAAGTPSKKMIEPTEDMIVEAPADEDDKTQDEREAKKKRTMAVPGAGFMGGTADSFLADENWEYDGYVLRDRDQRMMISQGDVVFLNIGAASGVKPKMLANVYRVGKKVKDPYLKKKAGRMIKRVGTVIVTGQITDEGCTAVVTNSLEPIRIGDIVKFVAH